MSNEPVTLLVTGSRALADTRAARWWAMRCILRALSDLPRGSTVVTGDASGPDAWTRAAVLDVAPSALALVVYDRHGSVYTRGVDGVAVHSRWRDDTTPPAGHGEWRTRLLDRDRAMVAAVARAQPLARCLAVSAPWSPTKGTAFTAARATEAGIVLVGGRVHECPVAYGPRGGIG